jgi:hypothetical protein
MDKLYSIYKINTARMVSKKQVKLTIHQDQLFTIVYDPRGLKQSPNFNPI